MKEFKTTNGAFIIRIPKNTLATIKETTTASGIILVEDRSFDSKQKTEAIGEIIGGKHIGKYLLVHPNSVTGVVGSNGNIDYSTTPDMFKENSEYYYFHINKEACYGIMDSFDSITMFDNFALVEGNDIKEKVSKGGLVLSISDEREFDRLTGIIHHIAPHKELSSGDNVLLIKYSNFEYVIRGKKWWLIDDVKRKIIAKLI